MVKKINEMADLQKAFRDAGDEPIMIEFYATWCPPCKAISRKVLALSRKYPGIKVFKVDVDQSEDIAKKYKVNAMPTFKVFVSGRAARGGSAIGPSDEELEELFEKYNK